MLNYPIIGIADSFSLSIYIVLYVIFRKHIRQFLGSDFKLYERGLFCWFIGTLLFFSLFYFYYGWGDTFNYFSYGKQLQKYLLSHPNAFFEIYFSKNISYLSQKSYYFYSMLPDLLLFENTSNYFVIKIVSLGLIFTFGSYLALSLIFTTFAYSSLWLIFSIYRRIYPDVQQFLYITVLLLPNTIIWGNGISKESLYLTGLGILFWGFYYFIIERKKSIKYIFAITFGSYLIFSIKSYIFFCIFPSLLTWRFLIGFYKYYNVVPKKTILFTLSTILSLALIGSLLGVGNFMSSFAINTIIEEALTYGNQVYELSESMNGSSYKLSDFDPTVFGVLKIIPEGLITALFRPFIWEIRKPINLLSSIEGVILFTIILYLIYKIGILKFLQTIFKSPNILFCLIFSTLFLIGISISSFNFGTLIRYKLPGEMFFVIGLCLIYYEGYLKPMKSNEENSAIYYN